jgi:hypothetical protein
MLVITSRTKPNVSTANPMISSIVITLLALSEPALAAGKDPGFEPPASYRAIRFVVI